MMRVLAVSLYFFDGFNLHLFATTARASWDSVNCLDRIPMSGMIGANVGMLTRCAGSVVTRDLH